MENFASVLLWGLLGVILVFCCTALTGAPYVPTLQKEINHAFRKLYKLGKKDVLVDLGSGDGAVLLAASALGAKSYGIEINPFLVFISRWRLRKYTDAKVILGNIFDFQFPDNTSVVYLFGESRDILKFAEKIRKESERLEHPLYVISQGFELPGQRYIKTERAFFLYKIDANCRFGAADI